MQGFRRGLPNPSHPPSSSQWLSLSGAWGVRWGEVSFRGDRLRRVRQTPGQDSTSRVGCLAPPCHMPGETTGLMHSPPPEHVLLTGGSGLASPRPHTVFSFQAPAPPHSSHPQQSHLQRRIPGFMPLLGQCSLREHLGSAGNQP